LNIILGKGIEQIRFGISRALLEKKLGTADKVDTDESGNPLLIYNRLQCTFWLNEDNELHWIQCSNSSARLWGEIVIGQPFAAQTEFLESFSGECPSIDDYGSMESYSFGANELELQVEYGIVTSICFGNFWNDDETAIFPKEI
jgi:hypothetical protein